MQLKQLTTDKRGKNTPHTNLSQASSNLLATALAQTSSNPCFDDAHSIVMLASFYTFPFIFSLAHPSIRGCLRYRRSTLIAWPWSHSVIFSLAFSLTSSYLQYVRSKLIAKRDLIRCFIYHIIWQGAVFNIIEVN